jgi:large subunit ribosomal protein L25
LSITKLTVEPRDLVRKIQLKKVRSSGLVPGVMYSHGKPATLLSVKTHELDQFIASLKGRPLIDLVFSNSSKVHKAIIQDVHRDPVTRRILHVDFLEAKLTEKLRLEIPLKFIGNAEGVRAGGILEVHTRQIKVEALPKNIPEYIEVDVSALKLGHSLHISDLIVANVEIHEESNKVLASIAIPKAMKSEEVEEAKVEEETSAEEKEA